MRLNTLKPGRRRPQRSQARRPRYRFRPGQDLRSWPQGFVRASGKGKIKAGFEGGQMPMQHAPAEDRLPLQAEEDSAEVMLYQLDKLEAGEIDFAALRAAKLVPSSAKRAKIVKKGEADQEVRAEGAAGDGRCQGGDRSGRRQGRGVSDGWRAAGATRSRLGGGLGKFTELRQRLLFVSAR